MDKRIIFSVLGSLFIIHAIQLAVAQIVVEMTGSRDIFEDTFMPVLSPLMSLLAGILLISLLFYKNSRLEKAVLFYVAGRSLHGLVVGLVFFGSMLFNLPQLRSVIVVWPWLIFMATIYFSHGYLFKLMVGKSKLEKIVKMYAIIVGIALVIFVLLVSSMR